MIKCLIKPLSVNVVWRGRRFKTQTYKDYEKALAALLPDYDIPAGPLSITIVWGFSSSQGDWDNPIKPFQDVLQKRYSFNDSRVRKGVVHKVLVPKGSEFILFDIQPYHTTGELSLMPMADYDTEAKEKEALAFIKERAAAFAAIAKSKDTTKVELLAILMEVTQYDKLAVIRAFRDALREVGIDFTMTTLAGYK